MIRVLILVLLGTLTLAGCNEPDKPAKTVSEYRAQPEALRDTLKRCNDDPGHTALSAACVNAHKAEAVNDAKNRGGLDVEPMNDVKLGGH